MKKLLVAGIAAAAFCGAPALAADIPVKAPAPAYVGKGPVAYASWTGCYVGAHAGWGWGKKDWSGYDNGYLTSNFNVDGGLLGGQLGCNYQFPASSWIIGIEGSGSAANIKGSGVDGYPFDGPTSDNAKVTSLASITGRIGWNGGNPQHLFYAKGGWAWARDKFANNYYQINPTPPFINQARLTRSGWTVGAGWEWAFAQNWSAFLEYDHYDLGSKTTVFSFTDEISRIKQTIDTVKVGVNYRFDWGKGPVVSKY